MNTAKHLLLDNDGTDNRIKFEFDFDYNYENDNNKEGTFTCRNCGKHEYRNGEFKTIKMGDIFTHITHFRTPGEDLCAQCDTLDDSSSTKKDQNDIKPLLNNNTNSKNTPNGKSSSTITNNNTIMNNNNNNNSTITTSKIHISDHGSTIPNADIISNLIQNRTMEDRSNHSHDLESQQQQLQGIGNHPQTVPIITPNNLSTSNNTVISFDGSRNSEISIKSEKPVIAVSIGHNINNNNITNTNSNQENILSHNSQFNSNPTNNLNLNESTYTFNMTNSSSSFHETSSASSSTPTQGVELPMTFIISHPQLQHEQSSSPLSSSSSNPPTNTDNNSTLLDTATTTTSTTTSISVSNTLQSPQQQQQLPGIISDLGNTSNNNGPSTLGVVLSGIPSSSITTTSNSSSSTTTTTDTGKKFVCKTCNKEFKNKKTKNLHIQRVHENLARYFCHICAAKFAYRGSLDSHLASHTTPEITHDCTKCPRKFKEKSNLTNHMKIHSDNPKKFCCEFCPSQFSKRVNLRYHCKRKHPDEYMNSSAFSAPNTNNNNNNNTQITTGTFSQSQQQSNSNNHNHNTNMSYNIPMSSPSGFNSTTTNDTPNNNNNNNNNKEKPPGNFKCEHCGRTFLFKNNLKAHLRVHTKDKKYTCDICEKSFIYKESLKNHMLLHTQELPYECHICQKKFRDRSNRRKHVKNVHKFLFLNGEDATGTGSPTAAGGTGNTAKNGTSPQGKPTDNNNTTTPAKKRRNNNKKNQNDADGTTNSLNKTPSGNNRKKAANNNNTKANNSNPRNNNNNNKSVIVSTANSNVMLEQDRKIIMSPSPKNPMSPLEYSHLPVTVHVPGTAAGGLHQHYISTTNRNHNVIVKAGSVPSSTSTTTNISSPQPDLDLYHRSQNVIVYPKSKGNDNYMEQNSVISHNNLLHPSTHLPHPQSSQQQQYYRVEESFDTRQNPQPTYMTLPISSPQSNSQPQNLAFDFVPSQEPVPIKIEQDHSHNNNSSNNPNIQNAIRYSSENHESIQQQPYSTPMYIAHHPDPHHQYWTIATSNDPNNSSNPAVVPISTSSPYSTSSTTNVSYVSPITAPHPYGSDIHHQQQHPTPGDQPSNTYYYNDLSKFDFSFL